MSSSENTAEGGGDIYRRALERLDDLGSEAWKPIKEPKTSPAKIVVRVLKVDQRTVQTSQGSSSAIVVTGVDIGADGNETDRLWDVWCWHTVLRREMTSARPQPGDVIACAYRGKVTPAGGGNAYESYKVARADDQSGGEFDWGAVGPDLDGGGDAIPTRVVYDTPQTAAPAEDDIPF